MKILTIVEKDSSGLEKVLEALEGLLEERFVEGIKSKHRTLYEVEQALEMVRIYQHKINIESKSLTRFSENFIRQYATNNNACFSTAEVLFKKIQSTIKCLKEIFRKTTPRDNRQLPQGVEPPSVFDKSTLTNGEYTPDMYGLDSFPQPVRDLYHAIDTIFASSASVLALCHLMIEQEAEIRGDIVQIRQIYDESCDELLDAVRGFSKFMILEEQLPQNELEERRQKAGIKNFDQFLMDNYHKVDKDVFTQFLVIKTIREAKAQGLTEIEAELWRKNPEKGLLVRKVVENFDLIHGIEGEKDKLDSEAMVMFLKWCEVSESMEIRVYKEYFVPKYSSVGKLKILGWNTISGKRKQMKEQGFSDEVLISNFQRLIDKYILQMSVGA